MQFGIFSLPTYFPDVDGPLQGFYQRILHLLQESERLGFDSAWVNEHHFHPYGGMIPAPPVLLAALAARTTRIRIGTSVALLALHHPLEQAEAYAMVDQISGGRLQFGIGRGFMRYDYETMKVPWEQGQERLLESLDVVLAAWREQPFSHHGRHYDFQDVSVWPVPVQRPHPPIWAAATGSPASFAEWGRRGYNLLTVVYLAPPEHLASLIETYRETAAAHGHDPSTLQIATHYQVYCAEDRAVARRDGEQALRRYVAQNNAARAQGGVAATLDPERVRVEELVDDARVCIGTPDDCAAVLQRAREALSLTAVDCTFHFGGLAPASVQRSIELFAREVMPRFQIERETSTPLQVR